MKKENQGYRKYKITAAILITLFVASCAGAGSKYQDNPIGTGSGPNKLKKSPCACITLPNLGAPDAFNSSEYNQTSDLA